MYENSIRSFSPVPACQQTKYMCHFSGYDVVHGISDDDMHFLGSIN